MVITKIVLPDRVTHPALLKKIMKRCFNTYEYNKEMYYLSFKTYRECAIDNEDEFNAMCDWAGCIQSPDTSRRRYDVEKFDIDITFDNGSSTPLKLINVFPVRISPNSCSVSYKVHPDSL